MDSNVLRKKLAEVIEQKDLSLSKVEKGAGVPRAVLRNFINGKVKEPKVDVILAVSKFLEVDLNELLSESIEPEYISNPQDDVMIEVLDKKMLLDCVKYLIEYTTIKQKVLSIDEALSLIKKTYEYSKKYSNSKLDSSFMEWAIENKKLA